MMCSPFFLLFFLKRRGKHQCSFYSKNEGQCWNVTWQWKELITSIIRCKAMEKFWAGLSNNSLHYWMFCFFSCRCLPWQHHRHQGYESTSIFVLHHVMEEPKNGVRVYKNQQICHNKCHTFFIKRSILPKTENKNAHEQP